MITQRAKVVAITDRSAWVEISRRTACSACKQSNGCGVALLAGLLGKRSAPLRVPLTGAVQMGDDVLLGIAESSLLKHALLMYCIPLFALLFGAGSGEYLFADNELAAIVAGFTAMALAFLWVRQRTLHSTDPGLQPVIVKSLLSASDHSVCSPSE